jgi:exonuclease V gamma subunit
VVATVDDVSSTDTERIGALAELVSRVSRLVRTLRATARSAEWVAACATPWS